MVLSKANGGVSSARNIGLEKAKGKWIGFADADDWMEPSMYEQLFHITQTKQTEVSMCEYIEYMPDPQQKPIRKGAAPWNVCQSVDEVYEQVLRRDGSFTAVWNKLFSRDILYKDGTCIRFDETLGVGEDEVWLMQVLANAKSVAFVPDALYHWRYRQGSASRHERLSERAWSILTAKQRVIDMLAQKPKLQRLARSRMINDCYHLKVCAYQTDDRQSMKRINAAFKGNRYCWLLSRDVLLLRKGKVALMALLMWLHAPKRWVQRVSSMRRTR